MQARTVNGGSTGRLAGAFALVAAGLLVGVAGCARVPAVGSASTSAPSTPQQAQAQPLAPGLSVSCAQDQRAVMRQQVVNGQPMLDVQCVATADAGAVGQGSAPVQATAPAAMTPAFTPAGYPDGGYQAEPIALAPVTRQAARARTVAYRDEGGILTYEPRAVRRAPARRSVKKSAAIIGSSAGVGAGIGAAVGGKKGALIGAAIGGGGATLWDQITRRK